MSYYKMPGSLRWVRSWTEDGTSTHSILGPVASKALDGELFEIEPQPGVRGSRSVFAVRAAGQVWTPDGWKWPTSEGGV